MADTKAILKQLGMNSSSLKVSVGTEPEQGTNVGNACFAGSSISTVIDSSHQLSGPLNNFLHNCLRSQDELTNTPS